ncbi:beta-fructofuranosidase [Kwoniella mangroviensis CBS 10435]|uniref:Beta-fructofuranosidase n=1 Tax=Kwoniella mangroviensis CBS 10435 TaxID=1331196 RepID=A0A1B9IJ58_9TREE|nr:beta-fructofuranosidase [Kwoniella mangroviensis CBS 10435]
MFGRLIAISSIILSFTSLVTAQSTSTAPVPTGVPVQGDYNGPLRPRVHYSPPKGFMNDPNGLFKDVNGTWHLYYQYNPTDVVAGNQHWGHATSPDLYTWTNQPIALFPPNSTSGVFSGSIVVDPENTSGFFPNSTNGVVAIYTLNTPEKQVQEIAYSFDDGYTFTPYSGNPVLDVGSNQFRDPKVVRYGDSWVMVIAFASEYVIGIYTSPDLKEWTHASNVSHIGFLGVQYECPNLVEIPIRNSSTGTDKGWVLTISINPGAPLGGSITQYFPGEFNGTHFVPHDGATRLSNFGKDDYAGQFFYNESVSIGWASNWEYRNLVPTATEGWRSSMTLPRENYLIDSGVRGWELVQEIYDIQPILSDQLASSDNLVNTTSQVDFGNSTSVYFDMNITYPADVTFSTYASINFTFSTQSSNEQFKGGYILTGSTPNTIWVDRGNTNGFDYPLFTNKFSASQVKPAERIQGIIDHSLFEVYVDNGSVVGTVDVYPTEPFTSLSIGTGDLPEGSTVSLQVWGLKDTWA